MANKKGSKKMARTRTATKNSRSTSSRTGRKKQSGLRGLLARQRLFSRSTLMIFILLFAGVGGYLVYRSYAATDTPAYRKLGLFQNNLNPANAATYEKWAGRNVDTVLQFFGKNGTSSDAFKVIRDDTWWCTPWAGSRYHVVASLAILPTSGVTLADGAAGKYNSNWVSFAKNAVASGCSDATLRPGWEFNGKFYHWTIEAGDTAADNQAADNYAAYYRQIVNSVRSVPGANFTFDWTPLAAKTDLVSQATIERAYPGDAYVDYIGLDSYDTSGRYYNSSSKNYSAAWDERLTQDLGLYWHRDFAIRHNKPVTYPEWGVTTRVNDSIGGDDNPQYIQNMYNWFNSLPSSGGGSLKYAIYFDQDAQDAAHKLSPTTSFPNASAKFKSLFGGSVTSAGDSAPPSVSISSPLNTATVSGSVNISATASDNVGVSKVTIAIDGSVVATDTSSPYSYSWDTTGTSDGPHTVVATAYDAAGNTASASATVAVKNSSQVGIPDLVVTSVTTNPANPSTGENVKLVATIKNQGTAATSSNTKHGVVFRVDGQVAAWSDTYYSSLAAGASVTLTANSGPSGASTWTATGGSHTIEALVDDKNLLAESNEDNNVSTASFNVSTAPTPVALGSGLLGEYYNNKDLTSLVLSRTDSTVNFNWGKSAPASGVDADTFSVRWTGFVLPPATNTYTFYVKSDDGVRLWVNDKLMVDNWRNQSAKERSNTISLSGGQKYSVKIEYYDNTRNAFMQFSWSSPSISKQVVPKSQLFPN